MNDCSKDSKNNKTTSPRWSVKQKVRNKSESSSVSQLLEMISEALRKGTYTSLTHRSAWHEHQTKQEPKPKQRLSHKPEITTLTSEQSNAKSKSTGEDRTLHSATVTNKLDRESRKSLVDGALISKVATTAQQTNKTKQQTFKISTSDSNTSNMNYNRDLPLHGSNISSVVCIPELISSSSVSGEQRRMKNKRNGNKVQNSKESVSTKNSSGSKNILGFNITYQNPKMAVEPTGMCGIRIQDVTDNEKDSSNNVCNSFIGNVSKPLNNRCSGVYFGAMPKHVLTGLGKRVKHTKRKRIQNSHKSKIVSKRVQQLRKSNKGSWKHNSPQYKNKRSSQSSNKPQVKLVEVNNRVMTVSSITSILSEQNGESRPHSTTVQASGKESGAAPPMPTEEEACVNRSVPATVTLQAVQPEKNLSCANNVSAMPAVNGNHDLKSILKKGRISTEYRSIPKHSLS